MLYVDGKPVAQTGGICRLAGKLSGLYPMDDLYLAAKVDEAIDFGVWCPAPDAYARPRATVQCTCPARSQLGAAPRGSPARHAALGTRPRCALLDFACIAARSHRHHHEGEPVDAGEGPTQESGAPGRAGQGDAAGLLRQAREAVGQQRQHGVLRRRLAHRGRPVHLAPLGWLTAGVLDGVPKGVAQPFPALTAALANVDNHPKVIAWRAKFPKLYKK